MKIKIGEFDFFNKYSIQYFGITYVSNEVVFIVSLHFRHSHNHNHSNIEIWSKFITIIIHFKFQNYFIFMSCLYGKFLRVNFIREEETSSYNNQIFVLIFLVRVLLPIWFLDRWLWFFFYRFPFFYFHYFHFFFMEYFSFSSHFIFYFVAVRLIESKKIYRISLMIIIWKTAWKVFCNFSYLDFIDFI